MALPPCFPPRLRRVCGGRSSKLPRRRRPSLLVAPPAKALLTSLGGPRRLHRAASLRACPSNRKWKCQGRPTHLREHCSCGRRAARSATKSCPAIWAPGTPVPSRRRARRWRACMATDDALRWLEAHMRGHVVLRPDRLGSALFARRGPTVDAQPRGSELEEGRNRHALGARTPHTHSKNHFRRRTNPARPGFRGKCVQPARLIKLGLQDRTCLSMAWTKKSCVAA